MQPQAPLDFQTRMPEHNPWAVQKLGAHSPHPTGGNVTREGAQPGGGQRPRNYSPCMQGVTFLRFSPVPTSALWVSEVSPLSGGQTLSCTSNGLSENWVVSAPQSEDGARPVSAHVRCRCGCSALLISIHHTLTHTPQLPPPDRPLSVLQGRKREREDSGLTHSRGCSPGEATPTLNVLEMDRRTDGGFIQIVLTPTPPHPTPPFPLGSSFSNQVVPGEPICILGSPANPRAAGSLDLHGVTRLWAVWTHEVWS